MAVFRIPTTARPIPTSFSTSPPTELPRSATQPRAVLLRASPSHPPLPPLPALADGPELSPTPDPSILAPATPPLPCFLFPDPGRLELKPPPQFRLPQSLGQSPLSRSAAREPHPGSATGPHLSSLLPQSRPLPRHLLCSSSFHRKTTIAELPRLASTSPQIRAPSQIRSEPIIAFISTFPYLFFDFDSRARHQQAVSDQPSLLALPHPCRAALTSITDQSSRVCLVGTTTISSIPSPGLRFRPSMADELQPGTSNIPS